MKNRFLLATSIAATLCAGVGCASAPVPVAGTRKSIPDASDAVLFARGRVITDPARPARELTLLVRGGRVERVDTDAAFAAERAGGAREIPLDGLTVVPGLTDAHAHLYELGEAREWVNLLGVSKEEALERVRQKVAERKGIATGPVREWIQGRGWDQNLWPGKAFPRKEELDAVEAALPVLLTRVDGHAAWANSAALALAGIRRGSADPDGGKIVRDADGEPTGVLVDRAIELVTDVIPDPGDDVIRRRLLAAMNTIAKAGLTEIHDAGEPGKTLPAKVLRVLETLAESGSMPIRVYHMLSGDADPAWLEEQLRIGPRKSGRDDRLRVRTVKLYLDGALGSRGAALLEDYSDDPKNRGLLLTDPAEFRKRAEAATRAGFQVAVHAIGDRGNRLALDTYEALRPLAGADPRFRIEHAQIVDPADIPRFAKIGVVASMQPTHATSDMSWAPARLGEKRLAGAYAWKSFLKAGVHLAGGSDFPVEEVSPLLGLYSAVTRADADGKPAGGWLPEQKLTPQEALAMFTTGAAYAGFEEKDRGRIAPGFRADLTVFRGDPTTVEPAKLRTLPVVMTVVGGQVVHEDRATTKPGSGEEPHR